MFRIDGTREYGICKPEQTSQAMEAGNALSAIMLSSKLPFLVTKRSIIKCCYGQMLLWSASLNQKTM
jgi:hypothetical protein